MARDWEGEPRPYRALFDGTAFNDDNDEAFDHFYGRGGEFRDDLYGSCQHCGFSGHAQAEDMEEYDELKRMRELRKQHTQHNSACKGRLRYT